MALATLPQPALSEASVKESEKPSTEQPIVEHASHDLLIVGPGDAVRLRAEEPGMIVEATIGGGLLVPAPQGIITAPNEPGDHWLVSAARDSAGLRSPLRWTRLRVDATAPTVTLSLDPAAMADVKGREWAAPSASVTATAEDSEAGPGAVELIHGDRTLRESGDRATGPLGTPPEGQETITLQAIGEDAVGNRSEAEVLEVMVDAKPPTGRIFVEGPWTRREGDMILGPEARLEPRGRDRESGLRGFEGYRLDGKEVAPEAWGPPWTEGAHTADVVAVDRVGNRATLETFRFAVDLTPPELTLRVLPEGAGRTRVEALGQDSGAGIAAIQKSADGETWSEIPAVGVVPLPPEGLWLRALDRGANERRIRLDGDGQEVQTGGAE